MNPAKKLIGREIVTTRENKGKSENLLGFKAITFRVDENLNKGGEDGKKGIEGSKSGAVKIRENLSGGKEAPKVLRAVEIKQERHPHNFSSISAQVFCSSSEISD
jgi:hypothetical protein